MKRKEKCRGRGEKLMDEIKRADTKREGKLRIRKGKEKRRERGIIKKTKLHGLSP
jgi:hypothetical protein